MKKRGSHVSYHNNKLSFFSAYEVESTKLVNLGDNLCRIRKLFQEMFTIKQEGDRNSDLFVSKLQIKQLSASVSSLEWQIL